MTTKQELLVAAGLLTFAAVVAHATQPQNFIAIMIAMGFSLGVAVLFLLLFLLKNKILSKMRASR